MTAPLQKYLGWVQRFLYQVEVGPVPFPQPVLTIDHDWPLRPTISTFDGSYTTIAGTVTRVFNAPAEGRHNLVLNLSLVGDSGVAIPATDVINLLWDRNPSAAPGFQIARWTGVALNTIHFIGGVNREAAGESRGGPAIYIPSGFRVVLTHVSAAGGVIVNPAVAFLDLPSFQPLRLP